LRIALANVQFHEGNNMFPPLGVLYVAGALRAQGHSVTVIDGDPCVETDMADRMAAFRPDLVGVSFLTMTYVRAAQLVRDLQERLPGVPVMVGGPHATAEPRRTLTELGVDIVVRGEGEVTACEIAERLSMGDPVDGLPGVVTAAAEGPPRAAIADVDAIALPARDLCDFERYLSPPGLIRGWASARHASVLASRGCRYRCTFCASHLQLGRVFRVRSVDDVLAELDELVARWAIRGVYWVDDIFTGDKPWVRAFCKALARRPYRLEWACQSRVESVDRRTLELMRDAGCVQVDSA
jgi:Fe-S oxidoreductase